tara:strand:+ start:12137 stop:13054 length:918 start_codon:yes stop_codon:yes gene_type:complete
MNEENTSGEDSQPQTEAFNVDNIISELTSDAPTSEATTEAPAQAEPEVEVAPEATPDEQKELLSPLLAEKSRREREARAEIDALKGSQEQAVADARADLVKELISDPQGFIAKHDIENAGDLAMHFYAADLGDDAPDDLKAQIGMSDLERYKQDQAKQFEDLRAEIAQREEHARNKAVIDQYDGFLSEVPADLPYLAVEAQHDQRETLKAMAQVADVMHQQNGVYPSAGEVAKLIDREIAQQAARYKAIGQTQPDVKQTQVTEPVETPVTLSTDNSGRSAKKSPAGYDEHFEAALDMFNEMFPKT